MRSSGAGASVCRFADYELYWRTLELRKSGRKIKLAPQPARVRAAARLTGMSVSVDQPKRQPLTVPAPFPADSGTRPLS